MAGRGRGKTLPAWMTNPDAVGQNVQNSFDNSAPSVGQFSDAREIQQPYISSSSSSFNGSEKYNQQQNNQQSNQQNNPILESVSRGSFSRDAQTHRGFQPPPAGNYPPQNMQSQNFQSQNMQSQGGQRQGGGGPLPPPPRGIPSAAAPQQRVPGMSQEDKDYQSEYSHGHSQKSIAPTNTMPQGLPQSMPQGLPQGPPQGISQGMPQGISQGLSQNMPQGMSIASGIPMGGGMGGIVPMLFGQPQQQQQPYQTNQFQQQQQQYQQPLQQPISQQQPQLQPQQLTMGGYPQTQQPMGRGMPQQAQLQGQGTSPVPLAGGAIPTFARPIGRGPVIGLGGPVGGLVGVPPRGVPAAVVGDPINDVQSWSEHDAEDKRKYWYNRVTGTSTYDKPACLKTPEERSIPPCKWKEYTSADGKKYYSDGKESR